jgi:2'-deoxynucleoside 5'-phosphate N-hydrolase
MRIYLACTVRGDRSGVKAGREIARHLQHRGHEILTTHLLADDVDDAEAAVTERDVFERDMEWLSQCEVLVAEASGSSFGVGFEVGYILGRARESGQRVLLLYESARRASVSRLIVGNCDAACVTLGYESLDEVLAFLDRHLVSEAAGSSPAGSTV